MLKTDVAVLGVLAASLTLNVYLGVQLRAKAPEPALSALRVGDLLPAFQATRLQGSREWLRWTGQQQPTVIYIFTPPCAWCSRNATSIKTLALTRASGYRFIGISLSSKGLQEHVQEHKFPFPIYADLDSKIAKALRLGPTPQTILVAPDGKVMSVWTGAYTADTKADIERTFAVTLPEVQSEDIRSKAAPISSRKCVDSEGAQYDHGYLKHFKDGPMSCDGTTGQWIGRKQGS